MKTSGRTLRMSLRSNGSVQTSKKQVSNVVRQELFANKVFAYNFIIFFVIANIKQVIRPKQIPKEKKTTATRKKYFNEVTSRQIKAIT